MRKPLANEVTTKIGKYTIPVTFKRVSHILSFSGEEKGRYIFWTAKFKNPAPDGRVLITVRSHLGFSAGERFDRMYREGRASYLPKEDRKVYRSLWKMMEAGKNVKYIRPATLFEVTHWLASHRKDVLGQDYSPELTMRFLDLEK